MKRFAPLLAALAAGLLLASVAPAADQGAAFRASLATAPLAPKVAPKGHDVTIVIFFDYQCGYCKSQHLALMELLKRDRKVRLVYRDWPIFGTTSVRAARLAVASQYQGRHAPFHDALMRHKGKLDEAALKAAARTAGVDWGRLQADATTHRVKIDTLLAESQDQAGAMELEGTPAMVIGSYIVPGAMNLTGLLSTIAKVRAE